jgi:hypothetical protein
VRIGTWNLKLCPERSSDRGRAMTAWMDAQAVDVWLLTEVHRDWAVDGFVVSPPRGGAPEFKRWAGIGTALPFAELRTAGDPEHPGEEGLRLARLRLEGTTTGSLLVACSVLPWRGCGKYWPGLPEGQAAEFTHVLDHHVDRIAAERLPGEPIVWGGDFNQQLTAPFWSSTEAGAAALAEAFAGLGLIAPTESAEHLNGTSYAIDHLAVSAELVAGEPVAAVHRPAGERGQLSDHAAYTADIGPTVLGAGARRFSAATA